MTEPKAPRQFILETPLGSIKVIAYAYARPEDQPMLIVSGAKYVQLLELLEQLPKAEPQGRDYRFPIMERCENGQGNHPPEAFSQSSDWSSPSDDSGSGFGGGGASGDF